MVNYYLSWGFGLQWWCGVELCILVLVVQWWVCSVARMTRREYGV